MSMESSRKQRILIVDDDSAVQVSLALLLKQSGFDAVCSDDPQQALAALAQQPVDLVLQDMNFSLQPAARKACNCWPTSSTPAPRYRCC